MNPAGAPVSPWTDAVLAAAVFAVDPHAMAGVVVRSSAGPVRDRWLARLRELLPSPAPMRRVPLHVTDDRLLGGLDLAATLAAGRPVLQRGLLAESDGGVVLLAMAERLTSAAAARITAALDAGEVTLERDGIAARMPARFGVVAFDEGLAEDERVPPALRERLALHVDLTALSLRETGHPLNGHLDPALARERLAQVRCPADAIAALCGAAQQLGIDSLRAPMLALRAACALSALDGRHDVMCEDVATAGRLVLAPRATRIPPVDDATADESETIDAENTQDNGDDTAAAAQGPLEDRVLAAVRAALPSDLLAELLRADQVRERVQSAGRAGPMQEAGLRGRPIGARRGLPRTGARLHVLATLRAAAPWQPIRRREHADAGTRVRTVPSVIVRRDDFHVVRYRQRRETMTLFAVDASGSSALHRLAEAKGAVELLLADCYVRRDQVCLLAFRGRGADLLLPPTRSLARAKRSLAALPGGGGTPLAAGLLAAADVAMAAVRRGASPVVVILTDGRANVARDGSGGRARAIEDALAAARVVRGARLTVILVDTSAQPEPQARQLAEAMGARYVALPHAGAGAIAAAVRGASAMAANP